MKKLGNNGDGDDDDDVLNKTESDDIENEGDGK